jgi:hypothetical protein
MSMPFPELTLPIMTRFQTAELQAGSNAPFQCDMGNQKMNHGVIDMRAFCQTSNDQRFFIARAANVLGAVEMLQAEHRAVISAISKLRLLQIQASNTKLQQVPTSCMGAFRPEHDQVQGQAFTANGCFTLAKQNAQSMSNSSGLGPNLLQPQGAAYFKSLSCERGQDRTKHAGPEINAARAHQVCKAVDSSSRGRPARIIGKAVLDAAVRSQSFIESDLTVPVAFRPSNCADLNFRPRPDIAALS